jgi:hypothetical protein
MTDPPVTTRETADLLHHIRSLSDNPTADPAERAETLARKADLLARLAGQRADEWDCEHATQADHLAHDARAIASQSRLNCQPQSRGDPHDHF